MASSSKKKTTMAKLNRESAVRDKRLRKAAKKDARKAAAAAELLNPTVESDEETPESEEGDEGETQPAEDRSPEIASR
jgi:hypothetical protein